MPHTHDNFLSAIAATPADRTLRLVYADWLDEHDDPRAELVRIEEEMRDLPVFADRFWELKPRRNDLRTQAGAEWCEQMRYGTECAPVFRHGIPDGWRERWRLIREFTERWHHIPMGDVGGRQAEIAEAEARLGRTLPPSVREWIAFALDSEGVVAMSRRVLGQPIAVQIHGQPAMSILFDGYDELHRGVRFDEFDAPDPSVEFYREEYDADESLIGSTPYPDPYFASQPVSLLALCYLLAELRRPEDTRYYDVPNPEFLYPELDRLLSPRIHAGLWTLIEIENFLIEFRESVDKTRHSLCIRRARQITQQEMPEIISAIWRPDDPIPF